MADCARSRSPRGFVDDADVEADNWQTGKLLQIELLQKQQVQQVELLQKQQQQKQQKLVEIQQQLKSVART
eukprot:5824342-Amphidinium_carterae.1